MRRATETQANTTNLRRKCRKLRCRQHNEKSLRQTEETACGERAHDETSLFSGNGKDVWVDVAARREERNRTHVQIGLGNLLERKCNARYHAAYSTNETQMQTAHQRNHYGKHKILRLKNERMKCRMCVQIRFCDKGIFFLM